MAQLLLARPEVGDGRLERTVQLAVLEQRDELTEHDRGATDREGDEDDDGIVVVVEDELVRADEAGGNRERVREDDLPDRQRRGFGFDRVVGASRTRSLERGGRNEEVGGDPPGVDEVPVL